jgi:hypothetical protein
MLLPVQNEKTKKGFIVILIALLFENVLCINIDFG